MHLCGQFLTHPCGQFLDLEFFPSLRTVLALSKSSHPCGQFLDLENFQKFHPCGQFQDLENIFIPVDDSNSYLCYFE